MMENCSNCGATLAAGAEWCGQCLTPVKPPGKEPEMSTYLRTQIAPKAPTIEASYSRWKAGPDSFGPVGRVLLTLCVAVLLVIGFGAVYGNAFVGTGIPMWAAIAMYSTVGVPAALWMLGRVWKRTRIR